MKKVTPTLDRPTSPQAIEFQDTFDKNMVQGGVQLQEMDVLLTEKQQSLKKKIFSLAKMEALVHPDPRLAAIYDEMAENGEEKYGYHYNETIMNIIFNEYILNDGKYLEKYKQAVPKKKKRRDKSGINALKKDAEDMDKRREEIKKERGIAEQVPVNEGSTSSGGSGDGAFESPVGFKDDVKNVSKELDTEKELEDLMTVREALPGQEKRAYGKHMPSGENVSSAIAQPEENKTVKKPFYKGGEITAPILNGLQVDKLKAPKKSEAPDLNEGVEETNDEITVKAADTHLEEVIDKIDDLVLFAHGEAEGEPEAEIDESTSAGSAGGAAGYTGYAGPAAWSDKGDLSGDFKGKKKNKKVDPKAKPISKIMSIGESNYLTDPSGFENFAEKLNENVKEASNDRISEEGFDMNMLGEQDNVQIEGLDQIISAIEMQGGVSKRLIQQTAQMNGMEVADVFRAIVNSIKNRQGNYAMNEKAKSKAQQRFMGMVNAYKNGEMDDASPEIERAADSMTDREVDDFARTKHSGLPNHVDEYTKPAWAGGPEQGPKTRGDRYFEWANNMKKVQWFEDLWRKLLEKKPLNDPKVQELYQLILDDNPNISKEDLDGHINYLQTTAKEDLRNQDEELPENEVNENPALMALGTAAATGAGQSIGDRVADKVGLEEDSNGANAKMVEFIINADKKLYPDEHAKNPKREQQLRDKTEFGGNVREMMMQYDQVLRQKGIDSQKLFSGELTEDNFEWEGDHVREPEYFEFLEDDPTPNSNDEKIAFIVKAVEVLSGEVAAQRYETSLKKASDSIVQGMYAKAEELIKEKGIDPTTIKETMIDTQEDSMKMADPIGTQGGGDFPRGFQSGGGSMMENKNNNIMEDSMKELEEINEDLLKLQEQHKELSEDRKPTTMVMKDRLGTENEKNFKSDLTHSGTKDIIDTTKELEWQDQQTDVGDDPMKLGADIEKEVLKNTKGEAFKDEGNSANNAGDEIPKRNLTGDEHDEVDLYRKGIGDFVYDNKPDERFEERMKRDMGDEEYAKRQARLEFGAEAPMYNKDTQPMKDGIEKVQFDKDKSEWNERMGIKENQMTGKYVDELGVTRFFDFNTINVQEVKDSKKGAFFKVDLAGMGNRYDSKVHMLESVENAINEWSFYTDGNNNVFTVKNPVQILTENEHKEEARPVNEQFNKMKHLLGYDPKTFTNTKNLKV